MNEVRKKSTESNLFQTISFEEKIAELEVALEDEKYKRLTAESKLRETLKNNGFEV